jgi:hypothetical protein
MSPVPPGRGRARTGASPPSQRRGRLLPAGEFGDHGAARVTGRGGLALTSGPPGRPARPAFTAPRAATRAATRAGAPAGDRAGTRVTAALGRRHPAAGTRGGRPAPAHAARRGAPVPGHRPRAAKGTRRHPGTALTSVTTRAVTRTRAEGPAGCDSARRPVPAARTSRSRPHPPGPMRWRSRSPAPDPMKPRGMTPPARRAAPRCPADPA